VLSGGPPGTGTIGNGKPGAAVDPFGDQALAYVQTSFTRRGSVLKPDGLLALSSIGNPGTVVVSWLTVAASPLAIPDVQGVFFAPTGAEILWLPLYSLPASGMATQVLPIPKDPALSGAFFSAQALQTLPASPLPLLRSTGLAISLER
jgi:hypothetical protein